MLSLVPFIMSTGRGDEVRHVDRIDRSERIDEALWVEEFGLAFS